MEVFTQFPTNGNSKPLHWTHIFFFLISGDTNDVPRTQGIARETKK